MEISGILAFVGIFIAILLILISIGYYGIKEPVYQDAKPGLTNENKKKKKEITKKQARDDSLKGKKSATSSQNANTQIKKRRNSSESSIEQEEEPIVMIPDPFTNQITSRFGPSTSNNLKKETQSNETKKVVATVSHVANSDSNTQQQQNFDSNIFKSNNAQQKIKPKATVKPNQAYKQFEDKTNSVTTQLSFKQSTPNNVLVNEAANKAVNAKLMNEKENISNNKLVKHNSTENKVI